MQSILALIAVAAALAAPVASPKPLSAKPSAAQPAASAATVPKPAVAPLSAPATSSAALDDAVAATLHRLNTDPAAPCSDEVFFRRIYIDLIGTIPDPQSTYNFLQDRSPNKRAVLIDFLFTRPEFADFGALKWCDILRVKSEFPINLWPNAVQAYHKWLHDAVRDDMPYDRFVRALLTSSGSNFRVPPANFYRAVQGRDPAAIAHAVALTFMGTRIDSWPEAQRTGFAAFFSRIAYKHTDEWKEEIVMLDPKPVDAPLKAVFPDGGPVTIAPDRDPREVFADWLISPSNPWFAKAIVNRVWFWIMGHGIIHEADDLRPDNPPASPELLALLEKELVASHYDLRHIFRLIVNSRTYQSSSIPPEGKPDPKTLFARYTVRRLDAEVLIDALDWLGNEGENYSSPIPEPYTFIPNENRTIALADGSITSQFLEQFGRPGRDTGLESERNLNATDAQRLYLINSADLQRRIERSPRINKLLMMARGNRTTAIQWIYLTILARYPTEPEAAAADAYFKTPGLTAKQASDDIIWALINSKEFMYRH